MPLLKYTENTDSVFRDELKNSLHELNLVISKIPLRKKHREVIESCFRDLYVYLNDAVHEPQQLFSNNIWSTWEVVYHRARKLENSLFYRIFHPHLTAQLKAFMQIDKHKPLSIWGKQKTEIVQFIENKRQKFHRHAEKLQQMHAINAELQVSKNQTTEQLLKELSAALDAACQSRHRLPLRLSAYKTKFSNLRDGENTIAELVDELNTIITALDTPWNRFKVAFGFGFNFKDLKTLLATARFSPRNLIQLELGIFKQVNDNLDEAIKHLDYLVTDNHGFDFDLIETSASDWEPGIEHHDELSALDYVATPKELFDTHFTDNPYGYFKSTEPRPVSPSPASLSNNHAAQTSRNSLGS